MTFEPLPPPGLAIFPQFLSAQPQTILMRGEAFGGDMEITYADGRIFLSVDAERFSLTHRKHLINATTGQKICEIRKDKLRTNYYGISEETGTTLFDTESHFKLGGSSTTLKFINYAAGGKGGREEAEELEFNSERFSSHGEFTYCGRPVASLMKKKMSMSGRYELQIAPGLDPFLIVVFAVAVLERQKEKNRARRNVIVGANAGGAGS